MWNNRKLQIDAYEGYGKINSIYAYGRVLKSNSKNIDYNSQNWMVNFWRSIQRLDSDEIEHQALELKVGKDSYPLQTNSEGYYRIDIHSSSFAGTNPTDQVTLEIASSVNPESIVTQSCTIYCSGQVEQYAVISDIDDTILETDVLNKMSALYNSIFVAARKRKAIKGSSQWYQSLRQYSTSSFYYISNSPWNFYYYLKNFLNFYHFPLGPIILRDFGIRSDDDLQSYREHKKNEIVKLFEFYPNLSFILIGDGGEHDTDIYLDINSSYPSRVKAIFIYRLGDAEHQRRIEKLTTGMDKFFFIHDAAEGDRICRELGIYS